MSDLLSHVAVKPVEVKGCWGRFGWCGAGLLTEDCSEESKQKLHSLTAGYEYYQLLPLLKNTIKYWSPVTATVHVTWANYFVTVSSSSNNIVGYQL